MTQDADVAVVGAGISGLTTGFWLARAGRRVTILEGAARVGGSMETFQDGDWLFEQGPNTVLESAAVEELIRDASFSAARLEATPSGKKRFLYKGGELLALPSGPSGLLKTPLFPFSAKLRLLKEPFVGRWSDDQEESVADFVRRRLGPAVLDYAVGPFVSGVWAGDPEKLAVRWALPRLAELEQHHGSLLRGMIAERRQAGDERRSRGPMISFREGFFSLARHLAEQIGDVRTEHLVRSVVAEGEGEGRRFRVRTDRGDVTASRVVIATSATATAEILAEVTEGESRLLERLPYAPVTVVSLGYRREQIAHPLDGFGFLAPRVEDLRILGCLFPSSLFPRRAPEGHVALTVFVGGRNDPESLDLNDDDLLDVVRRDLDRALGVTGEPVLTRIRRWPRAIPQYEIGHGRFVERAAKIHRDVPGLCFAVNWLDGTAVPECIERGKKTACEFLSC